MDQQQEMVGFQAGKAVPGVTPAQPARWADVSVSWGPMPGADAEDFSRVQAGPVKKGS